MQGELLSEGDYTEMSNYLLTRIILLAMKTLITIPSSNVQYRLMGFVVNML